MSHRLNDNRHMVLAYILLGCLFLANLLTWRWHDRSHPVAFDTVAPPEVATQEIETPVVPDSVAPIKKPARDTTRPKHVPRLVYTGNGFIWM